MSLCSIVCSIGYDTKCSAIKVHLSHWRYPFFISLYCPIIFHCMTIPCFVCISVDEHLRYLHFLALLVILQWTFVYKLLYEKVAKYSFHSWAFEPRIASNNESVFNFWEPSRIFSKVAWSFYITAPAVQRQFWFHHILTYTHSYLSFFNIASLVMWDSISLWFWHNS